MRATRRLCATWRTSGVRNSAVHLVGALLGAALLSLPHAAHAQLIGWLDGVWQWDGQYHVAGWACDMYSPLPVRVEVYDDRGWFIASGVSDQPNEPAVASVCGVPGTNGLRFDLQVPSWMEGAYAGRKVWVKARSNVTRDSSGNGVGAWLWNSGGPVFPDNGIIGQIDLVTFDGSDMRVDGWACARGIAQSIAVHMYLGPAGSATFASGGIANLGSEPAVASACEVSGGAYRFSLAVPFGPEMVFQFGGAPIWVHGISPVGQNNLAIGNSGAMKCPGQKAAVAGRCGYVPALWNVPYGALVLSRSNGGPILPVINAIGEWYTHSMLSLGTDGIAQAEMRTPRQNSWPSVCSRPVDPGELRYGQPGVERVNLGAAYADLQGTVEPPVYLWGDPTVAANVASWVVQSPWQPTVVGSETILRGLRDGSPINYSLFQYRDIEGTNLVPSYSVNNGMVCSTFLSYAHTQSGAGQISSASYSHDAIANAANALFSEVQNECNAGFGFWGRVGMSLSCPFFNVCENAGDQVTNCMSSNACDTNDNRIWHGVRDDPSTTATSISPDRLAGRPPHGVGTTTWSYDPGYHTIMWNAPGAQYGCWD